MTKGKNEVNKFISDAQELYPQELEVVIKNGKVSTNAKEPYFLAVEEQKLIVIDTKTPFSTTKFNQYNALAWVSQDSVFIRDDSKGQLKTIDLSEVDDFTLNKAMVNEFFVKISPWFKFITPVVIVGIVFGIYILYMFKLSYLLFLALLILILLKIIKKPVSYGSAYKVGLYAMTLGLLLSTVMTVVKLPDVPFLFTLVTLSVVLFNFLPAQKKQ